MVSEHWSGPNWYAVSTTHQIWKPWHEKSRLHVSLMLHELICCTMKCFWYHVINTLTLTFISPSPLKLLLEHLSQSPHRLELYFPQLGLS